MTKLLGIVLPLRSLTRNRTSASILGVLFCVLGLGFPAANLSAAEWSLEAAANVTGVYDDNIRLRATGEQSVFGAIFSPELGLRGRGELWDVKATTDLSIARYTEDSALHTNDVRFLLDGSYRTQLGLWGLDGEISRVSTLVTEATDAGNFDANADRDLISLAPSWAYTVTARDTVNLSAGWTEATYDTDALSDFRNLVASAGWSRAVTAVDVVSLSLFANQFKSESIVDLESTLFGAALGWNHSFSETFRTSISAGPQYFTTETPVVFGGVVQTEDDSTLGYRLDGSVDYDLDKRTVLSGRISHQIQPTSGGTPLQRDIAEASVRHDFLPKLSGSMRVYGQLDSDPADSSSSSRDRNYVSVEPRLTWRFVEEWSLSARYRFRTQKSDSTARAYSNAYFVTLSYRPLKMILGH